MPDGSSSTAVRTVEVVETRHELRTALARLRQQGRSLGLVPTMGALHSGHLSLVERATRECQATIVSIFVNPTQFGPQEDFQRYPRDLQHDLDLLSAYPIDLVFHPPVEQMYPPGSSTRVDVGPLATRLEGAIRPGHFQGVATVVLKLFNLVQPDVAYFGQKDFQQTLVVGRLIEDLNLPIRLCVAPTVREPDGLAKSSRNVYLSGEERRRALVLSRALQAGVAEYRQGQRHAARLLSVMHQVLLAEPEVLVDYLEVADRARLDPLELVDRPAVVLVAARVGKTRLIDNMLLDEN